jgi:hypothetical protein
MTLLPLFLQGDPAGGAALGEVVLATAGAAIATTALFGLALAHRAGRTQLLARAAGHSARIGSMPTWVALPSALGTGSLITALLGMYWDISLHIDEGRDAGPLANPAHYLILFGLFGIFSAGFLAMVLPEGRPRPSFVRIFGDWHAPVGGVLMCACGAFALIGFPLDDVWHRLFGQDVTLWGPTHLMLIGGASLSLIGQAVLLAEGLRARNEAADPESQGRLTPWLAIRRAALGGGLMIGLSTFQAEFDFGVPQFDLLLQPILLALAASVGLVAIRVWGGPGAALSAVAFFLFMRGFISLMVGGTFGQTTPTLPLYLAEALLVEGAALALSTRRPLRFGAVAGALIGTVGFAAQWGWTHVWAALPWPGSLLPEALVAALATAVAGGVLGALIGVALRPAPTPLPRVARVAVPAAAAALLSVLAFGLATSAPTGTTARVSLTEAPGDGGREAIATVRVDPPGAADELRWLTATAWQGGGRVVNRLERTGPGTYRSTRPLPLHGEWKTLIRMHSGRALLGVPVYLPADPAIPADAVPAPASFTRPFVRDKEILQREAKPGAPALTAVAYGVVAAITLSLLVLNGWALARLAAEAPKGRPRRPAEARERSAVPA